MSCDDREARTVARVTLAYGEDTWETTNIHERILDVNATKVLGWMSSVTKEGAGVDEQRHEGRCWGG